MLIRFRSYSHDEFFDSTDAVGETETNEITESETDVVIEMGTGEFVEKIHSTSVESGDEAEYDAEKLKNNSETQFSYATI